VSDMGGTKASTTPPRSLRLWETEAAKLPFSQLDKIRSAASQWLTTIGTLTTLSGLLLVFQGRNDVSKLPDDLERLIAILLFISFGLAFTAIVLAALAAQGSPVKIVNDAEGVRDFVIGAVDRASDYLRISRLTSISAALVMAIAIGITWFTQLDPPYAAPNALVIQESGTIICGALQRNDQGQVSVLPKEGGAPILDINAVLVQIVPSCPDISQ
jgi:hypothetical protein